MNSFHPIKIEVAASDQGEAYAVALEMLNEMEVPARRVYNDQTISTDSVEEFQRLIEQEARATESPQVRHTLAWVLNELGELT